MNRPVVPLLTLAEAEALVFFIAKRQELWAAEARGFGVKDPSQLPQELIRAHGEGVKIKTRRKVA